MRGWLFAIIALLLLMAVLYVCISPAVDLDPTITRAWQLAILLISSLAYLGRIVIGFFAGVAACKFTEWFSGLEPGPPVLRPARSVLHCSRLVLSAASFTSCLFFRIHSAQR